MAITSTDNIRILVEVTTGKKPAREDTAEEAEYRKKVTVEVREIEAAGRIVEIPFEMPDMDA